MEITPQQTAILEFIRDFIGREGVPPTQREIQRHFGFASRNSVPKHLGFLKKKGLLGEGSGRARALMLASEPPIAIRRIPLLGGIPAGFPSDQQEEGGQCIAVDADSLQIPKNARTFALKVRGDSMTGAAILDGDTVVIEFCEARNGDIVAALIDGETTLKRYVVKGGRPFLKAENPKYPTLTPAHELVIQGVLRAVLRNITRRV